MNSNERRRPDLAETPDAIDESIRAGVERALLAKIQPIRVEGRQGKNAAVLVAIVGTARRAHELFVFSRGDGALDRCVDYLDGVIDELGRGDDERFLPLDWEGRPFDGGIVFVRGEIRDYVAEEEAAKLLGEDAPRRGLQEP